MRHQSPTRAFAVTSATVLLFACAGNKDADRSDSVSAMGTMDSASGAMASGPGMGGMKHDSAGGMAGMAGMSNMTGNADQDFLRMMSDHHKAMIEMAHGAAERKGSGVKEIAARIDTKQDKELDQMVTMLERDFKDQYDPKVMPDDKKMADDLNAKTGKAFDRAFLEHTVMHHQMAIRMVDDYLPKLKNAQIKQMAEKIKADQAKEITEFKAKADKMRE